MRLKDFKIVVIAVLISSYALAQHTVSGTITHFETGLGLADVQVYNKTKGVFSQTNAEGYYEFKTDKKQLELVFFSYAFQVEERLVSIENDVQININLKPLEVTLSEVEISARKEKVFELSRLKDVEGTSIFAGKKTEVVLVEQSMANLASNNARQIYSQVVGLNIYQNDDAGLQLNIGGRGLDPNRTANFNTRQNGYDISADVLGYPESYYTPASEGLKEIQIIRGAAALQYGTQFGGLINFKTKPPNPDTPFELITRNTVGSYGLYTNFTSVSGTKNKWSYYSYFNYKKGDGFRANSEFESKNVFAHIGYQFNDNTSLTGELTYLRYLVQQGGGLSDNMFYANPYQSNRERNWFQVDWLLYNLKFAHQFTQQTNLTFNFFGLKASRNALGYRSNRVNQADPLKERDLIKGAFENFGFETRLLSKYNVLDKDATFLIGAKLYNANNAQQQGAGSAGYGANFSFYNNEFPGYKNQSQFDLPNFNVSVFGENILYINDKISITPGFRFEHIRTQSEGIYRKIKFDGADNVILNETLTDNQDFKRAFVLFGIGGSYKPSSALEVYANISQNYRSVTFSDINIVNPTFEINPDITDEKGFTTDVGLRGVFKNIVSYDLGVFGLFYNGRIGVITKKTSAKRDIKERGNIGDARTYGVESLFDFNLKKIVGLDNDFKFNYFINSSFVNSEYTASDNVGIKGNKVEFVPEINIKMGIKFGYKNVLANVQYSYLSEQFTDASNSESAGISGIVGEIPSYDILDLSVSYRYKRFKLETGINNILDNAYFTRRATGYPGPGIIPSSPRNYYATLQVKF